MRPLFLVNVNVFYLLIQSEVRFLQPSEAYSEPSQISKMELSVKIFNGFQIYIMKLKNNI